MGFRTGSTKPKWIRGKDAEGKTCTDCGKPAPRFLYQYIVDPISHSGDEEMRQCPLCAAKATANG
jgi:hypothetical protein